MRTIAIFLILALAPVCYSGVNAAESADLSNVDLNNVDLNNADLNNADLNDKVALEAFVDGVMNSSMKTNHVAGAVVSILRDNEVILAKGYGYSDVESKKPVNPETTLFRIGSVSKLFTYTALMQLHEQGKLDLEANIQDYLGDLKIPDSFSDPILVKHLFTHTAGFEDRVIGLFAKEKEKVLSYKELLATDLPERVRKPGLVSSYSNHSLGIAGLIIENISGLSWAEYIRLNILDPLGMAHTTGHQPVPGSLAADSSLGYRWIDGEFKVQPFEFVPLGSAGTMSASAVDMTRFMRAQFNGGIVDGNRILKGATLAQMHSPLYSSHESLDPWLYGFARGTGSGMDTLGHNGATMLFFTNFVLLPDEKVGLFVSTNSAGGGQVMGDLTRTLIQRFYPFEPAVKPLAEPSDMSHLIGKYSTYRHPFTSPLKLMRAVSEVTVVPTTPGRIKIYGLGPDPLFAVETSALVFQLSDTLSKVVFDTDELGQRRMFIGATGASFYKLGTLDTLQSHIMLSVISLLFLLWVLIAWPVQRFATSRQPSVFEHQSRWSLWVFSVVTLICLIGFLTSTSEEIVYGMNSSLEFFMNFAYLIPLMTLVSVALVMRLITDKGTELSVRLFHVVLGIVAVTICWMLDYWNFIGL